MDNSRLLFIKLIRKAIRTKLSVTTAKNLINKISISYLMKLLVYSILIYLELIFIYG